MVINMTSFLTTVMVILLWTCAVFFFFYSSPFNLFSLPPSPMVPSPPVFPLLSYNLRLLSSLDVKTHHLLSSSALKGSAGLSSFLN